MIRGARRWAGFLGSVPRRIRAGLSVLALDPCAPENVVGRIGHFAARTPDKPFIAFEGAQSTYLEVDQRIRRRSAWLTSRGIGRGSKVALMMGNHPEFLVTAWAVAFVGATISLVNTQLTGSSLRHVLSEFPPELFIIGKEFESVVREVFPGELAWVETRRDPPSGQTPSGAGDLLAAEREFGCAGNASQPATTFGDELFALVFTSGTTGLPKAGKISHGRAKVAAVGFGAFTLGLRANDTLYVCLPLFHSSGFLIGAGSVAEVGATLALSRRFSVTRFWDEISATRATAFVYIGELCRYLLNAPAHPKERDHRLTRIVGNGLRPDLWAAFEERFQPGLIHEFYGATEGNLNMTNLLGVRGSVGRMPPVPGFDNAFLAAWDPETEAPKRDPRGHCIPCTPGEPGELMGRIDPSKITTRFDGYLRDDATSAKIARDVRVRGDAYFRSGDLLKKDRLGFYYFVDRIGETFRWKGENVSTTEIADHCSRCTGVAIATVYGVKVPHSDGRAGMACLTLKPGETFDPPRFYEETRGLPRYAAPQFVRVAAAAAMTATWKLQKSKLAEEGFDRARVTDPLWVRQDGERTFAPLTDDVFQELATGARRL